MTRKWSTRENGRTRPCYRTRLGDKRNGNHTMALTIPTPRLTATMNKSVAQFSKDPRAIRYPSAVHFPLGPLLLPTSGKKTRHHALVSLYAWLPATVAATAGTNLSATSLICRAHAARLLLCRASRAPRRFLPQSHAEAVRNLPTL